MVTINTLCKRAFNVKDATFKLSRIETDRKGRNVLVISARMHGNADNRCPFCGRKCSIYDHDTKRTRSWRGLDFGNLAVRIESESRRIECKEHGVHAPSVSWAYEGSRFTRDFDLAVAWLATTMSKSAVSEFMCVDWDTVGRCMSRALNDIEPDRKKRLEGLVNIGIDETSYRKGYKYITVIVNHDTNTVVWIHEGHGKSVLEKFYGELSEAQKASIRVVTGDGARWITDCVRECTPDCVRCMDSFHVVEWANDALDEVRRSEWHDAQAVVRELERKCGKRKPGRIGKDDREGQRIKQVRDIASGIKGSSLAVSKNPENLTQKQKSVLEDIQKNNGRFYRAYLMKESLRNILKMDDVEKAEEMLRKWHFWATHSRIESFRKLSEKVKRNREFILNTIKIGMSNARIESCNNRIKLIIRRSFGFRNMDSMFDMIYLCCSNLVIPLPNRGKIGDKAA